MRARTLVAAAAVLAVGCADTDRAAETAGAARRDMAADGLYRDFLDGKFDAAGHPLGARVWQAETDCAADTGITEAEGHGVWPGLDPAGTVCRVTAAGLGRGRFTLNIRALAHWTTGDAATAFTVRVTDDSGRELARADVAHDRFTASHVYQNIPVELRSWDGAPLSIEIDWPGDHPVRIDYLELFRARRGLAIEPASGLLTSDRITVELLDPPPGYQLELACGEQSLTERLADQLATGEATRTDTEFRSIIDAPADLIADCPRPTRLLAEVVADGRSRAAARVTYYDQLPACAFPADSERPRVLLTGFEPFPADGRHDNSSEEAVSRFDPGALDIDLMTLILPVEWQAAADLVTGAIDRCQPDVVIGFGQGRSAVDVETIAYNVMDSSDVAGGVPDNRGLVHGGTPIVAGGDPELGTGLPAAAIVDQLRAAGITAGPSDDPGRYICNNLFYAIMTAAGTADFVGGFIHLPYIRDVGPDQAAMLQTTVETAVRLSLD